jgi:hypothetical protein
VVVALAAIGLAPSVGASQQRPGDLGPAFEPAALPTPRYGIAPPTPSSRQVRIVTAADGTDLYTETWLPTARDGHTPPAHVPVSS